MITYLGLIELQWCSACVSDEDVVDGLCRTVLIINTFGAEKEYKPIKDQTHWMKEQLSS